MAVDAQEKLYEQLHGAAKSLSLRELRIVLEAGATRPREPAGYRGKARWRPPPLAQSAVFRADKRIGAHLIDIGHLQMAALQVLDEYVGLDVEEALRML